MIIDIIQGLAFVPLYLNYIGERLYGLWLGTGGILAILAFLDMGMASLTIQRISREYGLKNFNGISRFFFGGLLINSGFMSILLFLGVILSFWLNSIFPNISAVENRLLTQSFQIALVGLILAIINNTIEGTLNALQKPLIGKIFQLIGAIAGIIVVYVMLLGNFPLLAIPVGILVRSALTLIPNFFYLVLLFWKNNIPLINYNKETIIDYLKLTPSLMLSKFGTSLVSNIEPTLINLFLTPEIAVSFSITKKAGTLIRTILDRIGGIIYPSIAHLYSDKDKNTFTMFFIQILNYTFPLTIILFLVYILLNKSFIALWVGPENYLGEIMTILISVSLFFSFISNFTSYLLSTTGDIKFSTTTVFYESAIKVVLLFLFIRISGVYGLPISVAVTSLFFSYIYLKRWNKHLLLNHIQLLRLCKNHMRYSIALIIVSIILYFYIKYSLNIQSFMHFALITIFVFLINTLTIVLFSQTYKNVVIKLFSRLKTILSK